MATGEIGPKPSLCIWNSETMEEVVKVKGNGLIKGIQSIAFSPSGDLLACVCIDDNSTIVVLNVDGSLIGCEKGDTAKILDLAWTSETNFTSVGLKHIKTWAIPNLKGT